MRLSFLLLVAILGLAEAIPRITTTLVQASVVVRCKKPWHRNAAVFLMEKDWEAFELDEDDTMDFGTYTIGKIPEMRLTLRGEEFEFTGLEPYLAVSHHCNEEGTDLFKVPLFPDRMWKSRHFDVIIDLDEGTSVVIPKLLFP